MAEPVDASRHYRARLADARALVSRLSARSTLLSTIRVLIAVCAIGAAAGAQWRNFGRAGWVGAAACFVGFVILVLVHDTVLKQKHRAERAAAWAEEGLSRLEDRWVRDARPSDPKSDDAHPYAGDLDIFGRGSLLQSIDTTRTAEGRRTLQQWLSTGATADEVALRQRCARDLAPRIAFLEELAVEGALLAKEPPDVAPLLAWAENKPKWSPTPALQVLALCLPAVTLGLLSFGGSLPIPRATWVVSLVAQILFSFRDRAAVAEAVGAASQSHDALVRYERMFQTIERATFEEPALGILRVRLQGAAVEVRRLGRVVGFVEARRNEVFRLLIGPLLLWDLTCALALERWRSRAGAQVRGHIDAMARVEALAALATRAFERPDDAWPEVIDATVGPVRFDAKSLGHPLIAPRKVVRNDVTLDGPGAVLLVTGSNMSGKSTLLRAIGTNVALALAGAPVRATSLRTSAFAVRTSMRVSDSLEEGISHFLAELRRLKGVIDAADAADASRGSPPVLFLLDEILHGTNSRERHLGARAIVRHLAEKHACGAVSTHDLALSALEGEVPGRVKNVHFREQVETLPDGSETMTFDYLLRPGVVTSSNALRLMRMVGSDIAVPAEDDGALGEMPVAKVEP